jgi:adenine deaminase
MNNQNLIPVARGEAPADLILANARVVNVFNGSIEPGNVAVYAGRIAGIGRYQNARETIDLADRYLLPGFIDGHVHLESSMLDVDEYARAVVPRGTLAVVTDLHEIANIAGIPGMRYVLDRARRLPLAVFLMAPSCVPATHLETSGAELDAAALRRILKWDRCIGLGEMMNYPGVLARDEKVMAKLRLAGDKPVDGHAPGLSGAALAAYIAAGIYSDHESVSLAEAREKLQQGMYIMIREGATEKNLEALLPLVTADTSRRCMLVVDDRSCVELSRDGDIDAILRKAIRLGLDPLKVIQMVTLNPAQYFRLPGLGAVAPGYQANMVVCTDLDDLHVSLVYWQGKLVARDGIPGFTTGRPVLSKLRDTINIKPLSPHAFRWVHSNPVPVIEVIPGQIVTRRRQVSLPVVDGAVITDVNRDILKIAVLERHRASGRIGIGMITGFGLKKGAIASSVAHDSHNIVAVGVDDISLNTAVTEIQRMQGGLIAVDGKTVLAFLPLPIAGLLSGQPLENTVALFSEVTKAAARLGSSLPAPFATLSFMALPVIPELKITDLGLVDVNEFKLIQ